MNFRALKRQGNPVTFTDDQVDELIALDDPELLWFFALTAGMSKEALVKLKCAAFGYEITRGETTPV